MERTDRDTGERESCASERGIVQELFVLGAGGTYLRTGLIVSDSLFLTGELKDSRTLPALLLLSNLVYTSCKDIHLHADFPPDGFAKQRLVV